ncbi:MULTISPECIES: COG4315 family predicted lipoprotein [unclassified Pseudomonas]|uniref:COG4315 family predicted lipoprotein n=1 Tax=unclassified Pseudomonas TaxID=196821 RepID=UPI0039B769C1
MTQMTVSFKALLMAAALTLPGLAMAADPAMEKDGMFTDHKGMTLYTFAKDSAGKSVCNDKCAANWPPLMAEAGDKSMGDWTVIKREDGSMQWAYQGMPLYTFVMDKKAGDMTGDGKMDGAWKVAKPD